MPLYDVLFDLEVSLSDRFAGLNPFMIRREKLKDVFLLMRRLNKKIENEEHPKAVKRYCTDDSWF